MQLEFEKSFDKIIYPENAKSYAYLDDGEIKIKGVPFNCYTIEYRDEVKEFFRLILEDSQLKDS